MFEKIIIMFYLILFIKHFCYGFIVNFCIDVSLSIPLMLQHISTCLFSLRCAVVYFSKGNFSRMDTKISQFEINLYSVAKRWKVESVRKTRGNEVTSFSVAPSPARDRLSSCDQTQSGIGKSCVKKIKYNEYIKLWFTYTGDKAYPKLRRHNLLWCVRK
jgi:hypothetical protein